MPREDRAMMPQTYAARSVAEAIKAACTDLGCEQDQLEIEILSPGMIGLFGICFKKARIRVRRKDTLPPGRPQQGGGAPCPPPAGRAKEGREGGTGHGGTTSPGGEEPAGTGQPRDQVREGGHGEESPVVACQRLLEGLLAVAHLPLSVGVHERGDGVLAVRLDGDGVEAIVGPSGEGLDALQYLVRKMLSRRFRRKVAVTLDAGAYREQRRAMLEAQARSLAEEVKTSGRSRATPPLNPAERRIVHMAVQGDPGVRSRSVGEGLYKKVVISPPGRRKGSGRRPRPPARGGRARG